MTERDGWGRVGSMPENICNRMISEPLYLWVFNMKMGEKWAYMGRNTLVLG